MNDSGLPPVSPVSTGKGFSIAGLVLGILSVILAWFYLINIVALVFGIIGLVMAVLGRNRAKAAGVSSGLGTAGSRNRLVHGSHGIFSAGAAADAGRV